MFLKKFYKLGLLSGQTYESKRKNIILSFCNETGIPFTMILFYIPSAWKCPFSPSNHI
jgi:hypothetical protein